MAIKIEMLRCFAAVAKSGNLADAAEKLGRTPSAVSMMLKQFEEHLGSPLFESERKNKLTAMGVFALGEAAREVDSFERTVSALRSFARSEAGFLRVAAVPSVAEAILPQVVRQLSARSARRVDRHSRYGLRRRAARTGTRRGRPRLRDGRAKPFGSIERNTLFSDAFGVVCRADHPLTETEGPWSGHALMPLAFHCQWDLPTYRR